MEKDLTSKLPSEITRFLENPGGHSLIVRGNAGTGKTTFALQVAEEFGDRQGAHYLSTRVSDTSLLIQFPWLEGRLLQKGDQNPPIRKRSGLGKLKGVNSEEMLSSRKEMSISIGRTMPDLERMYDLVEKAEGERQMIVVDSIDALADRYDMTCREVMIALQRDLVEGHGANLIFVLESNDHMLDYLGDGVVEFSRVEHDRRLVREMDLMKLRGCEVQQPLYLFSLKGGRFRCFGSHWDLGCHMGNNWTRVDDSKENLSYGIKDLDAMTGGLAPGSLVLIEMGEEIPPMISDLLERSLVSNFATAGRGVLWVPLRKASGSNARASLGKAVTDDQMERSVRVVEPTSQLDLDSGRYVLPVEGREVANDLKWKNLVYSFNKAEEPFLSIMGLDSLESIYGGDVMQGLVDHLASIKKNGGAFVGMTSPTCRSTTRLADLATVHVRAEMIGGTVILYGRKPFTECYALTLEERPQGGCVSLTPLV
ncbi:MAG TPA: gas vesicle protein GvpD P-loop domain-containing protein [Methanomassiliicoccales archaeon]|nr:gas vesicle protein GvpD P-loop domain-containing protein [Methanomassiliicoccales archaeon]